MLEHNLIDTFWNRFHFKKLLSGAILNFRYIVSKIGYDKNLSSDWLYMIYQTDATKAIDLQPRFNVSSEDG